MDNEDLLATIDELSKALQRCFCSNDSNLIKVLESKLIEAVNKLQM